MLRFLRNPEISTESWDFYGLLKFRRSKKISTAYKDFHGKDGINLNGAAKCGAEFEESEEAAEGGDGRAVEVDAVRATGAAEKWKENGRVLKQRWCPWTGCCKIRLCLVHPPWCKVVWRRSFFSYRCIPVISRFMWFHVFNAHLCSPLCIKRCPAFVNTFNHSHKFVQLSLALNPATFTNRGVVRKINENQKIPGFPPQPRQSFIKKGL
jgi:hypothetical protein